MRLSKQTILTFAVATLSGACLHFVYDLFPNPITALLSPVRESLWEHVKLVFWPGLAASLSLCRSEKGTWPARLLAVLAACAAMLLAGWIWHIPLQGTALGVDIGIYVLAMTAVFLLPSVFPAPLPAWGQDCALFLTITLAAAVLIFTFLPPDLLLFQDLSGVRTWVRLPC